MSFALYRVFIFCKNKDLAGYSKKISIIIMGVILAILIFTLIFSVPYNWDDSLGKWSKIIFSTEKSDNHTVNKKEKNKEIQAKTISNKQLVKESNQLTDLEKEYNKNVLKFLGLDRFIKIE